MDTRIVLKTNETPGQEPTSSDLVKGEVALNIPDKRLYSEDASANIFEIGTNPTSISTGSINATSITSTGLVSGTDISLSGTVTGSTLTDGTASLASGSWTSLVDVSMSGTLTFGSLNDGSITIDDFLNSDTMSGAAATNIPTALSVKNYVDAQVTASDLDYSGDTGGAQSVDLDSQTFTIAGGSNIGTTGSGQTLTVNLSGSLTGMTAATFSGTVTAATFSGDLTGSVSGNISGTGSSSLTTLATTNLTVGGVSYPSSDGGNGQVLSTNGSGTATWTSIPGLDANLAAFASNFTLPEVDGEDGQVLTQTSSGNLGFTSVSSGGGGATEFIEADSSAVNYVVKNTYEVLKNNKTFTGTWQIFSGTKTLHVVDATNIGGTSSYFDTNETLSSDRVFYQVAYIADAATITVPSPHIIQGVSSLVGGSDGSGSDKYRSYGELMYFGLIK